MPTVVSLFGVEPTRIGGIETFARELSVQLGRHGWSSVLCFQTQPSNEVAEFLQVPNVFIELVESPTNINLKATRDFIRVLRHYRPEILHLHFIGFVGFLPWLARLFSVKKIFFTDHSSRPTGYLPTPAPLWKQLLVRLINRPITKVICVSQYGYRCMTALNLLPKDRHEMIYNGVDLARVVLDPSKAAQFLQRFSIPDGRHVVVQVSWIIPEKGIHDLLKAAQLVLLKQPNVQFVIVGEGPYRKQYIKQANEMGLSKNLTWTGLMKDPFGEGVYDAADIVCQLSNWEEVFGWMISESMAFGKPVVATRVGGIPELVNDGESGFLAERGDTVVIAERILMLVNDRELREKMGNSGRLAVNANFKLE
jgi:glycosyltransferase involved in cell wall biosynthesis